MAGNQSWQGGCSLLCGREDPSVTVRVDEEAGQTLVGGMGELHLEVPLGA